MSKAGNILLLIFAFFAILGAQPLTAAKPKIGQMPNQASTCSSSLVSTQQCAELNTKTCLGPVKAPIQPQVAGAVVIAEALENNNPIKTEIAMDTLEPTITITEKTHDPHTIDTAGITPDNTPLNANIIFNMINEYRAALGLAAFQQEESVCSLASIRANEIIDEIGGRAGYLHSGLYSRGLNYWIWENAKYGSNEAGTVAWWKGSPVHHQSIVGDFKYSCVRCNGTYCVQLFTSFAPKSNIPAPSITPQEVIALN